VQVYDTSFHKVSWDEDRFDDHCLRDGFAPFNIQNVGGNLLTFAKQDAAKHDEVDGSGLGFVDVFSPSGRLLQRFEHGDWQQCRSRKYSVFRGWAEPEVE
jgi:hypothetical protein